MSFWKKIFGVKESPLRHEAMSDRQEAIQAQVASNFDTPLLLEAARTGDIAGVQQLLKKGANVNATAPGGFTSLYLASQNDHADAVKLLLAVGANVNAVNNDGFTPLYVASQTGHAGVVKLLLAAGANVNAAGKKGATPLYIASAKGHAGVVQLLLRADARVNAARTDDGTTPLMTASHSGHADVVQLLLAAGANVNATANDGVTPLWIASGHGHAGVVQLLLGAGARVNAARNDDGVTPLMIASSEGHAGVVQLLKAAGASQPKPPPSLIHSRTMEQDLAAVVEGALNELGGDRGLGSFLSLAKAKGYVLVSDKDVTEQGAERCRKIVLEGPGGRIMLVAFLVTRAGQFLIHTVVSSQKEPFQMYKLMESGGRVRKLLSPNVRL